MWKGNKKYLNHKDIKEGVKEYLKNVDDYDMKNLIKYIDINESENVT